MKLVENWRNAWRWHSMQVLAFLGLLPTVWAELPEDVKAMVPPEWRPWLVLILAAGGMALRLRKQGRS